MNNTTNTTMTHPIEIISAGAGSGKTYSLTQKLNQRLGSGEVQPAGVIATTFTRLAAGELRERVRQSLMQQGHRQLATQIEQAAIGTVHGICGQLLERFAFAAGLSPEQQVLEEGEANRLFGEALDRIIGDDTAQVRELNALARRLGIEDYRGTPQWRDDISNIAKLARANDCDPKILPAQGEQSARELLAYFRQPVTRDLNTELIEAIDEVLASVDTDEDATKVTRGYLQTLKDARGSLSGGQLPWSQWIKLSKETPGKKSKSLSEPVRLLAEDVECHPQLQRDIADYIDAVYRLAGKSLAVYQERKRQQGLMDFVDQEQQLYHLLDNPEVQETLREELQLLMVDEFQDTSPIQLALFVRLAKLADRVIWVGDIKQAIYGFRGSDPELMQAVIQAVQSEGGHAERLDRSWRSRPALVHYCNQVFGTAFANTLSPDEVALEPAHPESTEDPAVATWSLPKKIDDQLSGIAAGIQDLLAEGYRVVDKYSRERRALRLGDIAVLCRSNQRLKTLANACTQAGLAVSYKRPGLLATPECTLALACLRRMADPRDTLASAEIRTLADGHPVEQWLPERLVQLQEAQRTILWGETGDNASARLQALAEGRRILETLTPVEALDEAIERGDLRRVINQWGPNAQRARQRAANIDALCALAQEYQQHCEVRNLAATVSGLLMWLGERAASEEDWQAIATDDDTLTLVTYHGAKGLEWPVVIATDLDSPLRTRLWGTSVVSEGDALNVKDPLAGRRIRFWPFPFGLQSKGIALKDRIEQSPAGQRAEQQAREEEKRLLYVTFTRARDLLVLPEPERKPLVSLDALEGGMEMPRAEALALANGQLIPTAVASPRPAQQPTTPPLHRPHWLPAITERAPVSPRSLTPSLTEPHPSARLGRVVELGERIALAPVENMSRLGNALHGAITADIQNGGATDIAQVQALLTRFGAEQTLAAEHVLDATRAFIADCKRRYTITRWLPEFPIRYRTADGQEVAGFIDLLLETPEGWIIIDHKTAPQARSHWPETVKKYSGQLSLYREVVGEVTGQPVLETWLHLVIPAAMVEVNF